MKKKILFICTHNSARSQMAEGLTNSYFKDSWQAFSAGTEKTSVKPEAIEALKDIKIDISNHKSKHLEEFFDEEFDLVVTVCDSAKETCPTFPGAKRQIHAGFVDPSDFPEEIRLEKFKEVRTQIKDWLFETLSLY
jgi:arsenate reductase (thioredoxin)